MFRKDLPRVYEIRDQIKEPDTPMAYFQDFENSLQQSRLKMEKFLDLEKVLQRLDEDSWNFLKNEASEYLEKKIEWRGWEQFFNFINQAWGYNYLKNKGCSNIKFIPISSKRGVESPDLIGVSGEVKFICEVKTMNISNEEAKARYSDRVRIVRQEDMPRLEQGFFKKLMGHLKKAEQQIKAYELEALEVGERSKRIVYIITNFDDFWGEYKQEYFQLIDQYLSGNSIPGLEIVFHNPKTCFNQIITMECATVFNE